jgi:hypothetical protein
VGQPGQSLLVTLMCPVFIVGMLLSSLAATGTVVQELAQQLQPGPVVILGEQHRRPESARLLRQVVASYLDQGRCLTVGLEVAKDQQQTIDAVLTGEGALSAVEVHQIIDDDAVRPRLARLRAFSRKGRSSRLLWPRGSREARSAPPLFTLDARADPIRARLAPWRRRRGGSGTGGVRGKGLGIGPSTAAGGLTRSRDGTPSPLILG